MKTFKSFNFSKNIQKLFITQNLFNYLKIIQKHS